VTTGDPASAEQIQDSDAVARSSIGIPPDVDPRAALLFEYDRIRDERALSSIWKKYAPSTADVHACGLEVTGEINKGIQEKGGQPMQYLGFYEAAVVAVRSIEVKDSEGKVYSLDVLHLPRPGQKWHAHVAIVPPVGKKVKNVKATVRGELREKLYSVLGGLIPF